jgi:hypothetical protein
MAEQANEPQKFDQWAVVELMGRVVYAGKASDVVIAGSGFLRLDVHYNDGEASFTKFIAPGAIYSITPIDQAAAIRIASYHRTSPVQVYLPPVSVNRFDAVAEADSDSDDGPDF